MFDPFLAIFSVCAVMLVARRFIRRFATTFYVLLIASAVAAQVTGSAHTWFGVGLLASSLAMNAFAVHDARGEVQIGWLVSAYSLAQFALLVSDSPERRSTSFLFALAALIVSRFLGRSVSAASRAGID